MDPMGKDQMFFLPTSVLSLNSKDSEIGPKNTRKIQRMSKTWNTQRCSKTGEADMNLFNIFSGHVDRNLQAFFLVSADLSRPFKEEVAVWIT